MAGELIEIQADRFQVSLDYFRNPPVREASLANVPLSVERAEHQAVASRQQLEPGYPGRRGEPTATRLWPRCTEYASSVQARFGCVSALAHTPGTT